MHGESVLAIVPMGSFPDAEMVVLVDPRSHMLGKNDPSRLLAVPREPRQQETISARKLTLIVLIRVPDVFEAMGDHLDYFWTFAIRFTGSHCAIHPRRIQNA